MTIFKTLGLRPFIGAAALALMAQPTFAQQAPQEMPSQEMMDHSQMSDMAHSDMENMDHSQMENMNHGDMEMMDHSKMDHSGHDHAKLNPDNLMDETLSETAQTIVAKVNGLVCDFCAQALKKVFKKEDAVETISVDLDAGEVRVFLKDGQSLSDERVAKLIRKSGYSLVGITHENGA